MKSGFAISGALIAIAYFFSMFFFKQLHKHSMTNIVVIGIAIVWFVAYIMFGRRK